jgi:hypothetical protein
MNLPKSWSNVKLYQFKELRQLEKGEGYLAYQLDALAILGEVNSEDLEDLEIDEVNNLFKSVKFVLSEPKKGFKSKLTLEEEDYIFKPFNKLTLFEFIDLEYFLSNDYIVHISHIASVFYRRIDKDKWQNVEFEPYVFSPFERFELFDDVVITDVYGILTDYLKYRENFMQKYENLFNDNDQDDEDEEDINDFDSVDEYKDSLKQKEHGKKAKKWGWESLLYDLCEGDLTKIEDIGNQNLIFVFNMLSMRKDMGYLESPKG